MPSRITVEILIKKLREAEREGVGCGVWGFARKAGRTVDVACALIIPSKVSGPFCVCYLPLISQISP